MKQLSLPLDTPADPDLYAEAMTMADKLREKLGTGLLGSPHVDFVGVALHAFNNPPSDPRGRQKLNQIFAEWRVQS